MDKYHESVLKERTIELLDIQTGKKYIDATLGGGGHTAAILERGGIVLGIDLDEDALAEVREKFKVQSSKFKIGEEVFLAKGNFKDIDSLARESEFEKVSGILFDLGVSSHQFDTAERGFSFQAEGPLDMRMGSDLQVKASDLITILTKGELYELFTKLGEEQYARLIADRIVRARRIKPIITTTELAEIIERAVPRRQPHLHPATKVFQALRIAVNDELNSLREALPKALDLLEKEGRIAVISFHSLEDRIVKQQFKIWEQEGIGTAVTAKPVVADEAEMRSNRRSRSAKLRVFKKKLI